MTKKQAIQLFEAKKVRTVWDDEQEKWYFAIVDVVEVLMESVNPTDYIKNMKRHDPELTKWWGQIVTPLSNPTAVWPRQLANSWRASWVAVSSYQRKPATISYQINLKKRTINNIEQVSRCASTRGTSFLMDDSRKKLGNFMQGDEKDFVFLRTENDNLWAGDIENA